MPLLLNLMSLDQTREPAMLKELERHFMPVSSADMLLPTIRTGLTFLVLTNAMSATRMPEASVGAAMDAKDVEAVIAGPVGRAGPPPRARLLVAPNALPLHAHHLQPLFR